MKLAKMKDPDRAGLFAFNYVLNKSHPQGGLSRVHVISSMGLEELLTEEFFREVFEEIELGELGFVEYITLVREGGKAVKVKHLEYSPEYFLDGVRPRPGFPIHALETTTGWRWDEVNSWIRAPLPRPVY